MSTSKKVVYTCRDARLPGKDGSRNCKPGIGAYTSDSDESEFGRWTITFCDDFFTKLAYAEDLWNNRPGGPVRRPADLNSLLTYELTIVHEYFHVDWMGFSNFRDPQPDKPHIGDIKGDLPGMPQTPIYGAARCNAFA